MMDAAVRPGKIGAVLDHDRPAANRFDHADVDVAEHVAFFPYRRVGRHMSSSPVLQAARRAAHRDQVVEAIAAIDIEAVGHGSEPVRGIEIAIELRRPCPPPQSLTPIGELDAAQVVEVAAFGVQELAERALLDHVEDHHLHTVVVAVLHHHAVLLVLLGSFDHRPALIDGHCRRYFGGGVLSVLHRRQHDRHVPLPRCGVVDQIQRFGFAEPLEIARARGCRLPARDGRLR